MERNPLILVNSPTVYRLYLFLLCSRSQKGENGFSLSFTDGRRVKDSGESLTTYWKSNSQLERPEKGRRVNQLFCCHYNGQDALITTDYSDHPLRKEKTPGTTIKYKVRVLLCFGQVNHTRHLPPKAVHGNVRRTTSSVRLP